MEMSAADTSVIFSPLLTFIESNRGSCTLLHIKTVVLSRFTTDQIVSAKLQLWQLITVAQTLGKTTTRREGKTRTAAEAELADVFEALKVLEDADLLPRFAVYSEDIGFLPRIRAEDIDTVSLAERLLDLEEVVQGLKTTLSLAPHSAPAIAEPLQSASASTFSESAEAATQAFADTPGETLNSLPLSTTTLVAPQRDTRPRALSAPNGCTGDSNDTAELFRVPYNRRKAHKRRPLTRGVPQCPSDPSTETIPKAVAQTVQGKSKAPNFRSLKAGPGLCKDLFISNIANSTHVEDIRGFVKHQKCTVVALRKVSKENALSQSFCLTISSSDFEILNKPIWPGTIRVRKFHHRARNTGNTRQSAA